MYGRGALQRARGSDSLDRHSAAVSDSRGGFDWRMAGTLAGLALLIGLLWNTPLVYPLKMLVVFFHELSHGIMAVLTGGRVAGIQLVALEGGACYSIGGNRFLILSAGYLGSLLWGGALLLTATRTRLEKPVSLLLAFLVSAVTLLWVRPLLSFGFCYMLIASAGLTFAAVRGARGFLRYMLKLIGLTSCLYAPLDIISDTIMRSGLESDARMLAELTHIPTVVHGVIWVLLSLVIGVSLLIYSCRRPAKAKA